MPKKKKNRRDAQEPTEDTPAEELKVLRAQNATLNARMDKLLAKLEKYESAPTDSPPAAASPAAKVKTEEATAAKAATAAKVKAEAATAAKAKEQESAKEQKAKADKKKVGDSLDTEWELVPSGRRKPKAAPPEASIFGGTVPPPAPNEAGEETKAREAREGAKAAREADR